MQARHGFAAPENKPAEQFSIEPAVKATSDESSLDVMNGVARNSVEHPGSGCRPGCR